MNNSANARPLTLDEVETGDDSNRTDTLIKAALSLSQAIEALGSLNFFAELRLPEVKSGIDFYEEVRGFESALILEALRLSHGKQTRASSLLGLNPTTLNCMIKRLGIDAESLAEVGTVTRRRRGQRARTPRGNVQPLRHDLAQQ
jgi:transcriptional regulator with GAF, ATPase, and Fis domain